MMGKLTSEQLEALNTTQMILGSLLAAQDDDDTGIPIVVTRKNIVDALDALREEDAALADVYEPGQHTRFALRQGIDTLVQVIEAVSEDTVPVPAAVLDDIVALSASLTSDFGCGSIHGELSVELGDDDDVQTLRGYINDMDSALRNFGEVSVDDLADAYSTLKSEWNYIENFNLDNLVAGEIEISSDLSSRIDSVGSSISRLADMCEALVAAREEVTATA